MPMNRTEHILYYTQVLHTTHMQYAFISMAIKMKNEKVRMFDISAKTLDCGHMLRRF